MVEFENMSYDEIIGIINDISDNINREITPFTDYLYEYLRTHDRSNFIQLLRGTLFTTSALNKNLDYLIGSNRINKIKNKTNGKPDYYVYTVKG